MRARVLVIALAFAFTFAGCHCGKKTDEEILREKIDTTSVHLYLATKVAIVKSDASPEAREARKQLFSALEALQGHPVAPPAASDLPAVVTAMPSAIASAAASAAAKPATGAIASAAPSATSTDPPPRAMTAGDVAKLAKALWGLKHEGKALLKGRREDDLPPILPVLAGSSMPSPLLSILDSDTEHGLFLIALFVLKFHPRDPLPIPPEVLLYEAWMARADRMKLPGMGVPVRALKAVVFTQGALCDLAAGEGDALEKEAALTADQIGGALRTFGASGEVDPKDATAWYATARALAHGSATACYLDRDEREKALASLEKFLAAANDAGVPAHETAAARAYLAYERGDYDAAKARLDEAKASPSVDPETRKQIETLQVHFTKKDDGALKKAFDRTYFTVLTTKLVFLRLERSVMCDELSKTGTSRAIRDYLFMATRALASTREAIPTLDGAKKKGTELVDGLKKKRDGGE